MATKLVTTVTVHALLMYNKINYYLEAELSLQQQTAQNQQNTTTTNLFWKLLPDSLRGKVKVVILLDMSVGYVWSIHDKSSTYYIG